MAIYLEKIEENNRKIAQLEKNIKRETEERKRLLSEITKLRYLQLCDKLNCDGEELVTVLAKEHDQIQKMKDRGMTDKDIDNLGRSDNNGEYVDQIKFYSEEDDDENENA